MSQLQNRPSEEKRKSQRRRGLGRRIHGDRRTTEQPNPPAGATSTWKARLGQRRDGKRRTISDRRAR